MNKSIVSGAVGGFAAFLSIWLFFKAWDEWQHRQFVRRDRARNDVKRETA